MYPEPDEDVTDCERHLVKFAQTPEMSTYLLAFAVGDFAFTECHYDETLPVRVYTPCGKQNQGIYAGEV